MNTDPFLKEEESLIIEELKILREVKDRTPALHEEGRRAFLVQADALRAERPTSPSLLILISNFPEALRSLFSKKEYRPMFTTVSSIVLALALLFGGAGVAAYAAQDALPNDMLYPVKILTENLQVDLAASPQVQLRLLMGQLDRRAEEAAAMASKSEEVPAQIANRYEKHFDEALQLTLRMSDKDTPHAYEQLQNRLEVHEAIMLQTRERTNNPGTSDPVMAELREMIQHRLRLLADGLEDPHAFKHQLRLRYGPPAPEEPEDLDAAAAGSEEHEEGYGPQAGPGPDAGPGSQAGPGPEAGPQAGPEAGPGPNAGPGPDASPGGKQESEPEGNSQQGPGGGTLWNEGGSGSPSTPTGGNK
jgi:hypothetical protein